ncbi:MAG: thiopurine S-methyltransferase [Myxococcota bacterium]|jgi:thiopurine S-methyltransferase
MKPEFWHDRWQEGRIGFHQSTVHPDLIKHADALGIPAKPRVLVPLCGKTLDLGWLVGQGCEVVGVELTEKAATQYHETAGLTPEITQDGDHAIWRSPGLTYIVGDVFTANIGVVDAVWDRAALVALPAEMRTRYTARIRELLRPGGRLLLSCFTYDATRPGPPHSITDDEIATHYGHAGKLTLLSTADILDESPRWREAGATFMDEKTWLLER